MDVRFADGGYEQYDDTESFFGSEGILYRSRDGRSLVKLFPNDVMPHQERIRRIDLLINEFNPLKDDTYWSAFFSWPERRVISPHIGFRMRFAQGMRTIEHYFLPKSFARLPLEERGWFIGRVACAIKLVTAAHRLNTMGMCYPDFSGKNVLVDPFAGLTTLIDCDSMTVPGRLAATVDGSPEFRAPELVARAITTPTVETDRHALSVLLYRWLLYWHPLIGDRHFAADPELDEQLRFGKMATYIENPYDVSNRASKQQIKARALGREMELLFHRSFVDGLHNSRNRPHPFEWQLALYHMYDQIIPCATNECLWHFFVVSPDAPLVCPACQRPLSKPEDVPCMYLLPHKGGSDPEDYQQDEHGAHFVIGWPGRTLNQWHMRPDVSPVYTTLQAVPDLQPWAVFDLDQHTNDWYLTNISQQEMFYRLPHESTTEWHVWRPGEPLLLLPEMNLQFGPAPVYFRASLQFLNTRR